jgi:hypothetical protein
VNDRIQFLAGIAAIIGSVCIVGALLKASEPTRSYPTVTDADVRAYLERRNGTESGRQFDYYLANHDDTPAPKWKAPPITHTADWVLDDWFTHAVVQHDPRVTYWDDNAFAYSTAISGTSSTMAVSSTTGSVTWFYPATCNAGPIHTINAQ